MRDLTLVIFQIVVLLSHKKLILTLILNFIIQNINSDVFVEKKATVNLLIIIIKKNVKIPKMESFLKQIENKHFLRHFN